MLNLGEVLREIEEKKQAVDDARQLLRDANRDLQNIEESIIGLLAAEAPWLLKINYQRLMYEVRERLS